jgi:sulfite exporter TauE/SafE
MAELWPAFVLGLIGSLHCAGMCGPLALALPATGKTRLSFGMGRVANNLGRLATYGLLGALFGAIGLTFALAGFQRWASIIAGSAILVGLLASSRRAVNSPMFKAIGWLRSRLGRLMGRRTLGSIFLLGVVNGFLPCGLVYVACAGATALGTVLSGVEYMLAFGLGTVPVMLSIGLAGKLVQVGFRLRFQKLIPVSLVLLAASLILRGMSLGIPYLSPVMTSQRVHCPACH